MLPPSAQLAETLASVARPPAVRRPDSPEPASPVGLLDGMASISLAQLDAVALLNRVDTKYLLAVPRLVEILPRLADEYLVLEVGGRRLHQYQTLYFDTTEYDLYRRHRSSEPISH